MVALFIVLLQTIVHPVAVMPWWGFYLMGYLGVVAHVVKNAMKLGMTFEALAQYWKQTNLAIVLMFITYNSICLMWKYTDAFSFFGLNMGELNGMTIPLAYMADSIFADAVGAMKKKIQERNNTIPTEP